MAIKFEYSHEIKEASLDQVRSKIVAWLNAEGARKIKSEGMSVEAVHGTLKTFKPHERNGKKKLRFDLSPHGRSVAVTATASPSLAIVDDIQNAPEETRVNWGLLLEELWGNVEGVAATKGREKLIAEQKDIEAMRKQASKKAASKVLIMAGALDMVTCTVVLAVIVYFLEIALEPGLIVLLALWFCGACGLIVWGLLRSRA